VKAFVVWISARRYRLILLASALAPLLQLASAALIALETARRGVAQGLVAAGIGVAVVLALAREAAGGASVIGGAPGAAWGHGVRVGAMVRRGGFNLAFQGSVLLVGLAVLALHLVGPGPEALFAPMVTELTKVLTESGVQPRELEAIRNAEPMLLGLLASFVLTELLCALFLADWWLGLGAGDRRFGYEFRALRLGRVLGVPATVLLVVALVLEAPVVQNLAPLALFAFLFQGLSVLHAWAHAKHWHPGYLVPVYVLLASPLVGIAVLGLGGLGLADNWFDLRARR
jgi:hypothetical protein